MLYEGRKKDKARVTLLVAVSMAGKKLPLLCIGTAKTQNFTPSVELATNETNEPNLDNDEIFSIEDKEQIMAQPVTELDEFLAQMDEKEELSDNEDCDSQLGDDACMDEMDKYPGNILRAIDNYL